MTAVHFLDATHAFAIGPNTLLGSSDAGATWTSQAISLRQRLHWIDCADPKTCVLTVAGGAQLVRTTDGGATSSTITTPRARRSSAPRTRRRRAWSASASAARRSPPTTAARRSRAPAATSAASTRGCAAARPASSMRRASNGTLAISSDGGASWGTLATQTSANLIDVVVRLGVDRLRARRDGRAAARRPTAGTSWRTLDPGTSTPADSGRGGRQQLGAARRAGRACYRSVAGGRFNPVGGRAVASGARVRSRRRRRGRRSRSATHADPLHQRRRELDAHCGCRSRTGRATRAIAIRERVVHRRARTGCCSTAAAGCGARANGGRSWTELLSTGTSSATGVALRAIRRTLS